MNDSLRSTIIFTVGAAAGSVVTYFVTKNVINQQKEEEIESVKEIYRKAAEDLKNSKQKEIDDLEEARKEAFEMSKTYKRILKDNGYDIRVVKEDDEAKELDPEQWKPYVVGESDRKEPKVAKVVRMATKEEEEQYENNKNDEIITDEDLEREQDEQFEASLIEMSSALAERPTDTIPYIITQEQFADERPEYDKLTVTYYSGDMTLVDDHEELMDIDSTIGNDSLDELTFDNPCIYVRNDPMAIDYEVLWLEAGFAEVNGFEE